MILNNIIELLEAFAWVRIESKNPCMWSFLRDEERLNIYFTTGTVSIQSKENPAKYYYEVDENKLEEIIQ